MSGLKSRAVNELKFESKAVRLCLAPPTRVSDERPESAVPPAATRLCIISRRPANGASRSTVCFHRGSEEELSGISRPQDPSIQRGGGHNAVTATSTSSHGPLKESKYKEREAD